MSFLPIANGRTNSSSLRKLFCSNKALHSLSGRLCCLSGRILLAVFPLANIFFFEIYIDRNMKRKKTNIIYVTEVEIFLTAGLCISTIKWSASSFKERRHSFWMSQSYLIVASKQQRKLNWKYGHCGNWPPFFLLQQWSWIYTQNSTVEYFWKYRMEKCSLLLYLVTSVLSPGIFWRCSS